MINGTEKRYALMLEARRLAGEVKWYAYEGMTLSLAHRARYTPDFCVLLADGTLEFHECKGTFVREAALVRLKVAATMFPFRFILAQESGRPMRFSLREIPKRQGS